MYSHIFDKVTGLFLKIITPLSLTLLLFSNPASAQNPFSLFDGYTPTGLQEGTPAGSYQLGGFDDINLFNGNLSIALPLVTVGSRGTAGHTVMLPIHSVWENRQFFSVFWQEVFDRPTMRLPDIYYPKYYPGSVKVTMANSFVPPVNCFTEADRQYYTLTRLTFTSPNNTEIMLVDEKYNGEAKPRMVCAGGPIVNRERVFRSTDGSSVTFISDGDITDFTSPFGVSEFGASGFLMMKDGTRYRLDGGKVSWIRDRNGNKISFTYDSHVRMNNITDSLGRQVNISYSQFANPPIPYDTITYNGFGGAPRAIKVWYSMLSQTLRPDFTIKTYGELFPSFYMSPSEVNNIYDDQVVSLVELPDGRQYKIYYNPYGEVARVILPTGGGYDYDYITGDGGWNPMVYRPLTKKTTYKALDPTTLPSNPPPGTVEKKEIFSTSFQTITSNPTVVTVEQRDSGDVILAMEKHYFYGFPVAAALTSSGPTGYSAWAHGREFKKEIFNVTGGIVGATLIKIEHTWSPDPLGTYCDCPAPNPRIIQTTTTLLDTNKVSTQIFNHDAYQNVIDVYEYDFGTGAPGTLIRHTHTDYLTTNSSQGNINYAADLNIHIRNLPKQVSVFDGNDREFSRTEFYYDVYDSVPLQDCQNIVQHDGGFPTGYGRRGNLVQTKKVVSFNPNPPYNPTSYIDNYFRYDIAGNMVQVVDGNLNATNFDFSDRFGSPDDDAQQNTPPAVLNGQKTYAFPTKVTNALNHTKYTKYDYYLGKPVNVEDANGIVSSVAYNDDLDRPTQSIQARYKVTTPPCEPPSVCVPAEKRQTTITYDDANRVITTSSDRDTFGDITPLTSKSYYDGLGRTWRGAAKEGSTWSITDTQFDALGRVSQVSNPYRAADPGSASPPSGLWTTTEYDALSRVTKVTTPDGAHVDTAYSGNQVTVTDQAGKKRQSKTDALGRLTEVTEDPGLGGLGYVTIYAYDPLNNLRTVTQGSQTRTFTYNAMSRLISATNPESGTITYVYDPSGNLVSKTDARNITTSYEYDALNRNTTVSYSDSTSGITRTYDTATLGKGRLQKAETTGSMGSRITVNAYDAMGRPLSQSQQFFYLGAWGTSYTKQQTYDLAGNVETLTYPSGRTVNYSYDQAGRLNSFTGNLGDGVSRTYATITQYHPAGMIEREFFGTQTQLYQKKRFNNRLQLGDLRLSTVNDVLSWDRGAILFYYGPNFPSDPFANNPTNNGNLVRQDHFVPLSSGGDVIPQSDRYTYDQLNRISRFVEFQYDATGEIPNVATQDYAYDQWGNKRITSATGTGVNNYNPTYDTGSNRINGLTYDAAGNITVDPGGSTMTYDAENRMLTTTAGGGGSYTYDADGRRTRRTVGGQETWHVYGIGGELLAEYAAGAAQSSPQKENGYRNGQLLVTWDGSETGDRQLQWLVQDQLGSTRMIVDRSGTLGGIIRLDFAPFGEKLSAGIGIRTAALGYGPDSVRQKFGGKERDETGLDFFEARYFSSVQGRFTSPDEFTGGPDELYYFVSDASANPTFYADLTNPQSLNKYQYTYNNPLRYTDADGHCFPYCNELIGGVSKSVANVGIGIGNAGAMVTGDKPTEYYQPSNKVEAQVMETTDKLLILGSLLGGRVPANVAMAEGEASATLTSNAARRAVMREAGIPTSQQPVPASEMIGPRKTKQGMSYEYDVAGKGRMAVQQTADVKPNDPHNTHWEAGKVKPAGQTDKLGRPRLQNDKSQVEYPKKKKPEAQGTEGHSRCWSCG